MLNKENKNNTITHEQFDNLEKKISELDCRMNRIEELLTNIYTSSTKMDTHINFIENMYAKIQNPFFNVLNFFNSMVPKSNEKKQESTFTNEK